MFGTGRYWVGGVPYVLCDPREEEEAAGGIEDQHHVELVQRRGVQGGDPLHGPEYHRAGVVVRVLKLGNRPDLLTILPLM